MLNDAQRKLIEDNIGLVYKVINDKGLGNDEEALSFGFYGLCRAAENYIPSKGTFCTYAYNIIAGWVYGSSTDMTYRSRISSGAMILTDEIENYAPESEINEARMCLSYIYSRVDKQTKQILKLLYEGHSKTMVSKLLGIPYNRINKKIEYIRSEFKYGEY